MKKLLYKTSTFIICAVMIIGTLFSFHAVAQLFTGDLHTLLWSTLIFSGFLSSILLAAIFEGE